VTPARKRTCDVAENRHFIIARNVSCNNANLNEIKLRKFQTAFISTVSCYSNRHESTPQKANDTSISGVPRVSRAWEQTKFRHCYRANSWRHKI